MLKITIRMMEGITMKKLSLATCQRLGTVILAGIVMNLTACDAKEDLSKPQTEARTMIIGGVPVNERDYRHPKDDLAFNEAIAQDDDRY